MKITTLCVIIDFPQKQVLLAMKKRGFGADKWNAAGGKVHLGESLTEAAIRETKEEVGLDILELEQIGRVFFYFPADQSSNDHDVHFFLIKKWSSEPIETEEMSPKWFSFSEIPYNQMWEDDRYWLPQVIKGKKVSGDIHFDHNGHIVKNNLSFPNTFPTAI